MQNEKRTQDILGLAALWLVRFIPDWRYDNYGVWIDANVLDARGCSLDVKLTIATQRLVLWSRTAVVRMGWVARCSVPTEGRGSDEVANLGCSGPGLAVDLRASIICQ